MNQVKEFEYMDNDFYNGVKEVLEQARKRVYKNIQNEMVVAYWQIGKMIVEKQGGESRAKYGDGLIDELATRLSKDFGKGYTTTNLKYMRSFYLSFQKVDALRQQLSWSHYRLLMSLKNRDAIEFYAKEAVESNWSVRQLQRAINTFSYERYIASNENHDVIDDTIKREEKDEPSDIIKDPYVLEFTGIKPNSSFYESDLEEALISHLNDFLLN